MSSIVSTGRCTLPVGRTQIEALIRFALEALPRMRVDSGLFCYSVERGDRIPRGESMRYSLIVLLGLLKAQAHGYAHDVDAAELRRDLLSRLESPALTPGDLGLHLWIDARDGVTHRDELVGRLRALLRAGGGLPACDGRELGWIAAGLALHAHDAEDPATRLLAATLDQLIGCNQAPTGLFCQVWSQRVRRRFPNFAAQIYPVFALSLVARLGLDERALPAARHAAEALLRLQFADGGWPWIFDTHTGRVVERYEIYSVHQDAMAPLGLLELADVARDTRYARAVAAGLEWLYGTNELRLPMIDGREHMIYRSIRRRRPFDRPLLYLNALRAALGFPVVGATRALELNATCRPYELGWLLETWCGREGALDKLRSSPHVLTAAP